MNIFIAFAKEDRDVRDKLLRQMNLVKDRLGWNIWSAKEIKAGERWDDEIKQRLMGSEVVILLLSTDFFNSPYIVETELPKIVEKHKMGNCQIIPVIARVCHWKDTSLGEYAELGDIQALPVGEHPIVSRGHWDNDDQPYFETVQGIRDSIKSFQAKKQATLDAAQAAMTAQAQQTKAAQDQAEREQRALEKHKHEQADLAAQAQKERLAAEQRDQEDRARRSQAAAQATAAEQAKATQTARDREEQDRQDRFRREQEQGYRQADQSAWQQAADAHTAAAYEHYLAQYPQGDMAREARSRIKDLKRQQGTPMPRGRYAYMGGGVLALLWLLWWGFGRGTQLPETSKPSGSSPTQITQPTTTTSNQTIATPKQDITKRAPKEEIPSSTVPTAPPTKPAFADPFEGLMVQVAGGTFTMGSPTTEKDRSDDECQHQVTVGSFSIGKYEVTQVQWKAVMGSNPSNHKGCNDCPVEQVSWNDVQAFIKKLNSLTGKKYRLPTEAEWEYAAKGGRKSQHYIYAGGNSLSSVAWHTNNSGDKTHPVGGKSPNELGLYDMSGNVWEWCQDTWGPYSCDSKTTADGSRRVLRGGGWVGTARDCRSACRSRWRPGNRSDYIGFRLALAPQSVGWLFVPFL